MYRLHLSSSSVIMVETPENYQPPVQLSYNLSIFRQHKKKEVEEKKKDKQTHSGYSTRFGSLSPARFLAPHESFAVLCLFSVYCCLVHYVRVEHILHCHSVHRLCLQYVYGPAHAVSYPHWIQNTSVTIHNNIYILHASKPH